MPWFNKQPDLKNNPLYLEPRVTAAETSLAEIAYNVKNFGAVGDGVTLDYQAFKDATDLIKSKGSGTLMLEPNKRYLIFNGQSLESLFDMGSIQGFSIEGNGSTLVFQDANYDNPFNVFKFTNASKLSAQNLKLEGNTTQYPNILAKATFFHAYDKTSDIGLNNLEGYAIDTFIRCSSTTGHPLAYKDQAKRIFVRNINGELIKYGFSFQFNGSDVDIRNVGLNKVHRGYYPYGVKNHKVDITVKNFDAVGALLKAYEGSGLENIDLTLHSDDVDILPETPSATVSVQLAFGDIGDATHKNIKINLDVKNPSDKVDNAFRITNDGSVGGGVGTSTHTIDGLDISGFVKGGKGGALKSENTNGGTWSTLTFKNFDFHNLKIDSQGSSSDMTIEPLAGIASFRDIHLTGANSKFYLTKNEDGKDYVITLDNCIGDSIGNTDVYFTAKATYRNCKLNPASAHSHINKVYENTLINGKMYNRSYNNQSFETATDLNLWWNNYPQVIARKEVTGLANIASYALNLNFNDKYFSFGSTHTQPCIFRYRISFRNTTYSRIGHIFGEILLKSTSSSSVKLQEARILTKTIVITNGTNTADLTVSVTADNVLNFNITSDGGSFDVIGATILI
jgi:hypothetical protein